jgi:branched-subunit amino acid transport protein
VSDLQAQDEFLVAGAVAAVSVATGNISVGVLVGLALYWLFRLLGRGAAPAVSATSRAVEI